MFPFFVAKACADEITGSMQEPHLIGFSLVASLVIFAVITALLHVRGRGQWLKNERELTLQRDAARKQNEFARTLLLSESQIIVVWKSSVSEPEISGDIALVTGAPVPRRVLGFGAWLDPVQAQELDRNVEHLRDHGDGFHMALLSIAGRHLEADGRAVEGQAILRIRDVSGDRLELLTLRNKYEQLMAQADALRAMLDTIPAPVWMRDQDSRLVWVNAAFAHAVETLERTQVIDDNIELLDRETRALASKKIKNGEVWRARMTALASGERRLLDLVEAPSEFGSAGMAQDLSELEQVRSDLEQQMASHTRTLDQLTTAVAIFDGKKRLVFYNAAYTQLWSMPQNFLDQNPTDPEILDWLRAHRKIPEQADFRAWKSSFLSSYLSSEMREYVWHLPDGRTLRAVSHPSPQGGVTYLFDDVTERFNLESQFNALTRVQGETLDTLQEGVAAFGTDGRLKLYNPAFARLWRLNEKMLGGHPHFDRIAQDCGPLCVDQTGWMRLREMATGLLDQRVAFACRIERSDGVVLDCAAQPLPDGATLVTFIDVTAQVNVERALTDRNKALIEVENLRNDFVHHISYELRSPLTNIIGFIHLLDNEKTGPLTEKQSEYVTFIMKSSSALLAIINDILDFASIDRDGMELEVGDVDILETIRAASLGVQDRLAESAIELSIIANTDIGSFRADGRRIRQILFNLLSNAIGFSEAGQTVSLAAFRRDDEIAFKVTDTGRGIPPDVLDKVFDRFQSHTIGSRHRGVGLGLSIVRALVELHGGCIQIDSAPGEGTVVTCLFPARGVETATNPVIKIESLRSSA